MTLFKTMFNVSLEMLFRAGVFREGFCNIFTTSEAFAEIFSELMNMRTARHYAAWNFYMSLYDEPECDEGFSPIRAREFIDNYHDHYGNDTLVTDPMESAYVGVPFFFPSGSGSAPRSCEAMGAAGQQNQSAHIARLPRAR